MGWDVLREVVVNEGISQVVGKREIVFSGSLKHDSSPKTLHHTHTHTSSWQSESNDLRSTKAVLGL